LPAYSPEFNPDEMLNADLKAVVTSNAPARRGRPQEGHRQSFASTSKVARPRIALLPAWSRSLCRVIQVHPFRINNSGVAGIVAECGGGLACATCHCYVDETWIERLGSSARIGRGSRHSHRPLVAGRA
jgi:hypothetical protein